MSKPKSFSAQVGEQTDAYLHCRDLMHNWKTKSARRIQNTFEHVIECLSCGAEKTRILSRRGEILASRFTHYPEGYVMKGTGRLTHDMRAAVRLEALSRLTSER